MGNQKKNKQIHDGHRQRMRDRFLEAGLSGFQEHEILEMLLFYAIPRVNTNPLAHELINHFGSLQDTISASPAELAEIPGVTENAAFLLQFLSQWRELSIEDKCDRPSLEKRDDCYEYFKKFYDEEQAYDAIYMAILDTQLKVIRTERLNAKELSLSPDFIREITEKTIKHAGSSIILSIYHTTGMFLTTIEERRTAPRLVRALEHSMIELFDIIILSKAGYLSMSSTSALSRI